MAKKSWQEEKMQSLAKGLELENTQGYYEYIMASKINGNLRQVTNLFKEMPKENRKDYLSHLADETKHGCQESYELLKYLIEVL